MFAGLGNLRLGGKQVQRVHFADGDGKDIIYSIEHGQLFKSLDGDVPYRVTGLQVSSINNCDTGVVVGLEDQRGDKQHMTEDILRRVSQLAQEAGIDLGDNLETELSGATTDMAPIPSSSTAPAVSIKVPRPPMAPSRSIQRRKPVVAKSKTLGLLTFEASDEPRRPAVWMALFLVIAGVQISVWDLASSVKDDILVFVLAWVLQPWVSGLMLGIFIDHRGRFSMDCPLHRFLWRYAVLAFPCSFIWVFQVIGEGKGPVALFMRYTALLAGVGMLCTTGILHYCTVLRVRILKHSLFTSVSELLFWVVVAGFSLLVSVMLLLAIIKDPMLEKHALRDMASAPLPTIIFSFLVLLYVIIIMAVFGCFTMALHAVEAELEMGSVPDDQLAVVHRASWWTKLACAATFLRGLSTLCGMILMVYWSHELSTFSKEDSDLEGSSAKRILQIYHALEGAFNSMCAVFLSGLIGPRVDTQEELRTVGVLALGRWEREKQERRKEVEHWIDSEFFDKEFQEQLGIYKRHRKTIVGHQMGNRTSMGIRVSTQTSDTVGFTQDDEDEQDRVVDELVEQGVPVPRPWALFMAGGPGSGKGHVVKSLTEWDILPQTGIVHIDLDHVRTFLRDWKEDLGNPKSEATCAATQVEAGFICELTADRCVAEGKSFIFDGTFRNKEWNQAFIEKLKARAARPLRVCILLVDTSLDICQTRVTARMLHTGRPVPGAFVVRCNAEAKSAAMAVSMSPAVETFVHVDNDGELPAFLPDGKNSKELKEFFIMEERCTACGEPKIPDLIFCKRCGQDTRNESGNRTSRGVSQWLGRGLTINGGELAKSRSWRWKMPLVFGKKSRDPAEMSNEDLTESRSEASGLPRNFRSGAYAVLATNSLGKSADATRASQTKGDAGRPSGVSQLDPGAARKSRAEEFRQSHKQSQSRQQERELEEGGQRQQQAPVSFFVSAPPQEPMSHPGV